MKRKVASRAERRTVLVFCEGVGTEPDYLRGVKTLPEVAGNAAIHVEVDLGYGVPLTLAKRAVAQSNDPEIDECWCVFDVEWPQNHPNLVQAIALARAHGIKLAIPNPCFELWLILHFKDHAKFTTSDAAERASRKLDGRSGKRIDVDFYMSRRGEAVKRAVGLAARHDRDGTSFPHDNPSSSMYSLLLAIEPDLG